jgi:hypothetical protein
MMMWVAEAVEESLQDEAVVICNSVVLDLPSIFSYSSGAQLGLPTPCGKGTISAGTHSSISTTFQTWHPSIDITSVSSQGQCPCAGGA